MDRDRKIRKVTWIGLCLNVALSAVKISAGVFGHSQAVLADGVHSISDTVTDVAIIIGSYYWSRPPDTCHPYGHRRLETLITMFIGVILIGAGAAIGWEAIVTIKEEHAHPPSMIALLAAVISIIVKELLYQWTARVGKKIKSMSVVANAWHHRLDSFSSIPVFIAVGASMIFPEWTFLDHVGAVFVTALIFHAAVKIIFDGIKEFVDIGASEEVLKQIKSLAESHPSVLQAHGIRTRYMGSNLQVNLHVVLDSHMTVFDGHAVSEAVKKQILEKGPEVIDVEIHIEPSESKIVEECKESTDSPSASANGPGKNTQPVRP
jgi:cation diffusion facilitator family transporter